MHGHRSRHLTIGVILAFIFTGSLIIQAGPYRDEDNSQGFLSTGSASNRPARAYAGGLPFLSLGIEYQDQSRAIVPSGAQGTMPDISIQRLTGLIGLDLVPWVTLEVGAGMTDVDLEGDDTSRDKDWEWRVGGRARLLDYRIPADDPFYFGIEGEAFYRASQSENWNSDLEWNEFYSALLFSLSNHPLIHFGDDVRVVSLYGGPALSLIDGTWSDDVGSVDFHEDQNMGAVVGVSFMPDEFMTVKLEAQFFDDVSVGAGLSIHF
jgi:hypothetical protein